MGLILNHLRTAPPPTISPQRPLLPGAPPPSHLPLNPVLYLTLAIDSIAPLMRIRSQRGAAGGGVALQIPVPLGLRQRRRKAVEWILEAATKRRNAGSGKGGFAMRFATELIAHMLSYGFSCAACQQLWPHIFAGQDRISTRLLASLVF